MSILNSCVCMYPCAPMWILVVETAIISNTCCPLLTHPCVCMCPFSPMWPKIWYTTKIYETVRSMYTHVSVCAHGPPYGQWFESKLKPSIHDVHCELMGMYVPMCPHVGTGCRHRYNLQYVLSTVNFCDGMCPFSPIWPMVWYTTTTSETGFSLCTHVSV